jgi:YD repeat-containing protein
MSDPSYHLTDLIGGEGNKPRVLVPFDKREGLSLRAAGHLAGKSEATMRSWAVTYDLGRRVGGGTWLLSKVALQMHLDGNAAALRAYHSGDRQSPVVADYFRRAGLAALLRDWSGDRSTESARGAIFTSS